MAEVTKNYFSWEAAEEAAALAEEAIRRIVKGQHPPKTLMRGPRHEPNECKVCKAIKRATAPRAA